VLAFDAPPPANQIFHIAYLDDWNDARTGADREYRISTKGRTLEEQGFIHASATRDQVERVGAAVYASDTRPLVVVVVDIDELEVPVVAENLEGGDELFPHVYGPLPVRAVTATIPISTDGRRFVVDWDRPTAITEGRR
jgi:uncharacterized protein (DUF952 family)